MALDFKTKRMLDRAAASGAPKLHEGTVEDARAVMASMAALAGPAPRMARVEDHQLPVEGGAIALRALVPPQGARGVVVYLHGGGFVLGAIDEFDVAARKLAERTSCAVVLVDYRLAPEHRYPTAVEDSWAGLQWAAANVEDLTGRAGAPLIVAGDSAGGNLAAVLAQRARDEGGPALALQVLIYPVTDATFDTGSYLDPENQGLLTREAMVWFWDHYVPDAARRAEPGASPLRAESLAGVAPAVVLTAEHDVLRDEGEAYAKRLEEAGVRVEHQRHTGQAHGFFTNFMLPGSERGFQQVVRAIQGCVVRHAKATSTTATAPAAR